MVSVALLRCRLVAMLLAPGILFAQTWQAEAPALPAKKFFEEGVKRNGIAGASLTVIRNGKVIFNDPYGMARISSATPVDEETTFHWASITKTFTAIAIMQLRDRGQLSLDDPVVKHVPEIAAVHDPWGPVSAITIRHLLSHSAGFRGATWPWRDQPWQPFEPRSWSQIVAMLPYTEIEFAPGSRFSYSNLGIVFLGQIIERLSGDDFEVYIDKNILRPLGMYQAYFDRSPYFLLKHRSASYSLENGKMTEMPFDFDTGITVSNGGLNAPLRDMVKYLNFLLGVGDAPVYSEVLKRSSLEEMWRPVLPIASESLPAPEAAPVKDWIGLAFFILDRQGQRFIGHSGGQNGFISHIYIQPELKTAYVVAFNTNAANKTQDTRLFDRQLRDYLFDHFFQPAAK